jgi:hypothetical protein
VGMSEDREYQAIYALKRDRGSKKKLKPHPVRGLMLLPCVGDLSSAHVANSDGKFHSHPQLQPPTRLPACLTCLTTRPHK